MRMMLMIKGDPEPGAPAQLQVSAPVEINEITTGAVVRELLDAITDLDW